MIIKIFSILTIPFIYILSKTAWSVAFNFDYNQPFQLYFLVCFLAAFLLSIVFISANNFFSVFNHELCHLLWSLLSFKKPQHFSVSSSGKGEVAFSGDKNMMITLSPYFFPLYALVFVPLVEFVSPSIALYAVFGLCAGWSLSVQIKQANPSQSDLGYYGRIFSYLIIIFFQMIVLTTLFTYVNSSYLGVWGMLKGVWSDSVLLFSTLFETTYKTIFG